MVEPDRLQDDNIRRIRFACWITKAADTQNMQYFLLLHGNSGYVNAPQCCVDTYIVCL
jgi:hypothetical protein